MTYDSDFVEFADLAKRQFEGLVADLVSVGEGSNELCEDQARVLREAIQDAKCDSVELAATAQRALAPIDAGDLYVYMEKVIRAAFVIGRVCSAHEDIELAKKENAAALGRKRGRKITEASNKWKAVALDLSRALTAKSLSALTEKVQEAWPEGGPSKPEYDAIYAYIRNVRREGAIGQKGGPPLLPLKK